MAGPRNEDIDMADTEGKDEGAASTGEQDIRRVVETANAEDERSKKDDNDTDDSDDDDSDDSGDEGGDAGSDDSKAGDKDDSDDTSGDDEASDDDSDDEEEEKPDDKKPKSDRKFNQFTGDGTDQAYISNLEKAYQSSSAEAIKINQRATQAEGRVDAIMRAAAADPELATKLNAVINSGTGDGGGDSGDKSSPTPTDNPFVTDLKAAWEEKSTEEIDKFIEANPEVVSDPKIEKDVKHWMSVFSKEHFSETGRLLSGGDAMAQAYKHLGLENKLGKQILAAGAKGSAAPARPRGKAKGSTGSKPTFTPDQIAMAKSMGKDEDWLVKNAK